MVGVAGFEPAAFWSQTRRADQLRYTPTVKMPEGKAEYKGKPIAEQTTLNQQLLKMKGLLV